MNNVMQFPLLDPIRTPNASTHDDLMKMPWPRLVNATMNVDKGEAAKAVAAFHARLPKCGFAWDDLTSVQQGRWQQLVA